LVPDLPLLLALVFGVAVAYASVGHGGASGYLAVMALLGAAPDSMKPTALVLNLLVSGIGTVRYLRAGCFRLSSFWPFALGALPLAFLGGASVAPPDVYRKVLGVVLVIAALSLILRNREDREPREVLIPLAILAGAAIGFVSGLIGVGGGIFLSPLLILLGWATTKETLGISALFILLNSAAGLLGNMASLGKLPADTPFLAVSALAGGLLGTTLGAKKLAPGSLRLVLAAVLLLASIKLLLT
jgi:uncharacterized membrane protein YfcA